MVATLFNGDISSEIASAIRHAGTVAVDTETGGLNWERDELHLCQLYTAATGPVLVRRSGEAPSRLIELLRDPQVLKVFHFAPFDLRFLEAAWGVQVQRVACTKAASKLLDPLLPNAEHSLQALTERHLGIRLDKGSVRTSDWGAAHLTDEQLAYASSDVLHLLDLFTELTDKLALDGEAAALYRQVCAYLPVDAHLAVTHRPNPLTY